MKKHRIVPCIFVVFSIITMVILSFSCYASVIYKDITSISIRTIYDFDYDMIQEGGMPEIECEDIYEKKITDREKTERLIPEIDSNTIYIYTDSSKYYIESAEWYENDINEFSVGGQPKIVCYLVAQDYDYYNSDHVSASDIYYRFMSSYGSGSCYIGNCQLISAQRVSIDNLKVVFKLKNLKGTYNQPEDAFWADEYGTAQWNPAQINDSGCYDIILYRDNSTVAHITKYNGNSYNFYSYMTKPGNYSYKVRTVGKTDTGSTYGKSSEYVESNSLDITDDRVYDPSKGISNYADINSPGGATNPMNVGWIQTGNKWYFVRPDGEIVKNGWIEWNGKWYYLGSTGEMATGWLENNGYEYYLQSDGTMLVGWLSSGNTYFYFDISNGQHYGAMCKNMFVNYQNKYFYFDENGIMVTGWRQIKDSNGNTAFYYFYPNGEVEGLYGYMATNTTINGFYVGADGKWVQSSR